MGVKSFIKKSVAFVSAVAMACSMVVMPAGAAYAEGTTNPNDNLHLSKGIELQQDGNYKITLEAYATGQDTTVTTKKSVPLDIVLVLDQSGSMGNDFTTGGSYQKVLTAGSDSYYDAYNSYYDLYVLDNGNYCKADVTRTGTYRNRKYHISYVKEDGTTVYIAQDKSSDSTLEYDMYALTNTTTTTRLAALKSAVTNFVNSVEENAKGNPNVQGDEVDHRIAMVGFASGSSSGDGSQSNYSNTELFIGSTQYNYAGNQGKNSTSNVGKASDQYANAFQNVNTNKDNLIKSIDALSASGATHPQYGIEMANGIFENNSNIINNGDGSTTERKRVVIVFTDGKPGNQGFSSSVANKAIANSNTSKNKYGASVYSIGIFDGAKPSDSVTSSNISDANKFMHFISSNYNASSMDTSNPTGSNQGYYKAAANANDLSSIFESITHNETSSTTTVTLNSNSVLRDIISDNFELPKGAETSSVSVYTADSDTVSADGKTITWKDRVQVENPGVSISRNQVDVTGFDYSANYVTASHPGKKLIVEVLVNGLQSGVDMDSNDTEQAKSGIYATKADTTAVKNFVSPKVTIPEYSYVLDYGKKVTLPNEDKAYSQTIQMNSTKAAPTKLTSITKDYGTFTLGNNVISYQPEKINWDGFDSIFNFGKKTDDSYEWSKTDDSYEWSKVNVIPATSVYYEDDFGSFTDENPNNDPNVAIVWTGDWDTIGTSQNETQDADNSKQHGWDSSYKDDATYSNGSAHYSSTSGSRATFTFKGTGVDVYSKTAGNVGLIKAQLYKGDSTSAMKTLYIDNISESGDYYQIPTLSFDGLDYDTYKVKITVQPATTDKVPEGESARGTYYLDGIRVYNPLGVAPTDSTVINAYGDEYSATFKKVRDVLLDSSNFTDGQIDDNGNINENVEFDMSGAVFIDEVNGSSLQTTKVGTYKDYGPKNEVYLAPDQAIAFEINSGYNKLFVGAKGIEGATTMTVTDEDTTKNVSIPSNSDMYYEVKAKTSNGKKLVVIQNTGSKILSITKIRATGVGYDLNLKTTNAALNYATTFASLKSYDADESGMVIEQEEPDVDIDNATDDENNATGEENDNTNTSNSIWSQIINSINKWFGRR